MLSIRLLCKFQCFGHYFCCCFFTQSFFPHCNLFHSAQLWKNRRQKKIETNNAKIQLNWMNWTMTKCCTSNGASVCKEEMYWWKFLFWGNSLNYPGVRQNCILFSVFPWEIDGDRREWKRENAVPEVEIRMT